MPKHVVKQGECIASIAYARGFFWETVWQDSGNEALRTLRGNPNVLMPGDEVLIPEKTPKALPCATGTRHRFRLRSIPAKLHLKILAAGVARASEPYVIDLDGKLTSGTTGPEGEVDVLLFPDVRSAKITVGTGADATEYVLRLRELPPISEPSGVEHRLANLGYGSGAAALRMFQRDQGLPQTGDADTATVAALRTAHGV